MLRGQSPDRIAFLRKLSKKVPADGINPIDKWQDMHTAGKLNEYYLVYFGKDTPSEWTVSLPTAISPQLPMKLRAEIIDAWNITITPVEGEFSLVLEDQYRYHCLSHPTSRCLENPIIAIRLTRIHDDASQPQPIPSKTTLLPTTNNPQRRQPAFSIQ